MPKQNASPTAVAAANCMPQFTDAERAQILEFVKQEKYPPGDAIIREGNSTQFLWLITEGRCQVVKSVAGGGEQQLAILEAGAIFGEMSFFHPAPHSATVRTLTDVEVMRLSREAYDQILKQSPVVAYKISFGIAHVLAERLRKMDDWVRDLVTRDGGSNHREEWSEFRAKLYSDWQF